MHKKEVNRKETSGHHWNPKEHTNNQQENWYKKKKTGLFGKLTKKELCNLQLQIKIKQKPDG